MANDRKRISMAVIKRLPKYYRHLSELLEHDITRISSKELSNRMNITSSQMRQDLNIFGCFGQQGYGYDVFYLHSEIKKILGLDQMHKMIVIGVGNIGQALLNYANFESNAFRFIGAFDSNPVLIGQTISNVMIRDISELGNFLIDNRVDIAVLTIPQTSVSYVMKVLTANRVPSVWNFTPVDIEADDWMVVESVHLTESLMALSFRLTYK